MFWFMHNTFYASLISYHCKVVGSRNWPLISRYRAAVRTQSPKVEMIEALFKPLANGQDDGIMRCFTRNDFLICSPVLWFMYANSSSTECWSNGSTIMLQGTAFGFLSNQWWTQTNSDYCFQVRLLCGSEHFGASVWSCIMCLHLLVWFVKQM